MNQDLEKKLLLAEIRIISHAVTDNVEGQPLLSDEDLIGLDHMGIEDLRQLRQRLRDLSRTLGGTKGVHN